MGFRDLSLIKKIVLSIVSLVVLGVAIVAAIYFLPEKHQPYIIMNSRTKALEAQVQEATTSKLCQVVQDKLTCFKNFILKNGIQYAADINQYDKAALTICERRRNSFCYFELTHEFINMIDVEKYWATKNIEKGDKLHSKFRTMEFVLTERYIRRQRKLMVSFYQAETEADIKKKLLTFIESLDKQILITQKFQKP